MSKSLLAKEYYPAYSGNYTSGRSGRKIEAITIHHMAGKLTAKQCGAIFQKSGRNGSSHYGIGYNGDIACYVEEQNTAWTNSNWDSNCKSVTIETSDENNNWYVNDVTLNSLVKLVADIAKRNGLGTLIPGKNLTWHSMFSKTTCPGDYLRSKMQYIADEANKINNYAPQPKPQPSVNIEQLAKDVIAGKYGVGEARKKALGANYSAVQKRVNEILSGKSPAKNPTAPAKKSTDTIAREVIAGKWGNGTDRKNRLTKAGYNYSEIQKRVNQLLK